MISRDGQYLFAANRGHNTVAVFRFNSDSGKLSLTEFVGGIGEFPRDICLHPTHPILYVASQNSDLLTAFVFGDYHGEEGDSGKNDIPFVRQLGKPYSCATPVCIKPILLPF